MNRTLADIAEREARKNYHGYVCGTESNLHPVVSSFPAWDMRKWDEQWNSAFVYYCVRNAGIKLPVRYPSDRVNCNFAGCIAWEQWATLPEVNRWVEFELEMCCEAGDIVLFDSVVNGQIRDTIGIIVEDRGDSILVAEGNFNNVSAVVERRKDNHIRGLIHMNDF